MQLLGKITLISLLFISTSFSQNLSSIFFGQNVGSAPGGVVATWTSGNVGKEAVSDGVLAFPSNTAAGSLLIAAWDSDSTGTSITGCTDTQGNTWSSVVSTVNGNPAWQGQIFKAVNTAGGANTVTCTLGGTATFGDFWVLEYAKNSGAAPDVVSSASALQNVSTVGPVTTTLASAPILIVGTPSNGSSTACTASPSGTLVSSNALSGNSVSYIQTMTAGAAGTWSGTSCPITAFFSHYSIIAVQ